MSLPQPWVEKIFAKMLVVYGHDFLRRWDGLDLATVKADWAHELGALFRRPSSITWALDNLPPGRPPTVLEFRALCCRVPEETKLLPSPKAAAAVIAKAVASLPPAPPKPQGRDLRWAQQALARHEAGEHVSRFTLNAAREALKARWTPEVASA